MSDSIKGVTPIFKDNYSIFYIESLSDELKEVIRKDLSSICYGPADAESGRSSYSYNNTLKEFVKRYSTKRDTHQKGMIGELLLHIIMLELLDDFEVDSPFFNLEERSVKKGFDVVVNKKSTKPLSQTKIKNRFCSIIIESKNKRRILQDLSYIGFRADYIYPELEYTAKEIKRRYK